MVATKFWSIVPQEIPIKLHTQKVSMLVNP